MSEELYKPTSRFHGIVLAARGDDLIVATGGSIAYASPDFKVSEQIGHWDDTWRSKARRFSLSARLFRLDIGPSAWLGDTLVVVHRQAFLLVKPNEGTLDTVPFPDGIKAPLTLTCDPGSEGAESSLLFGDYKRNREMAPASMHRIYQDGRIETLGATAQGQVNHIHAIIPKSNGTEYFLLSGDYGGAARIWNLPRSGETPSPLTPAGQRYRSCWLIEEADCTIYATDRQDEVNEIAFIDPITAKVERISVIEGSSIDHLPRPAGMPNSVLFSTSVEGDNSEKMTLRHFLNMRKGHAFLSRNVVLYRYSFITRKLERLFLAKKDFLPFVPFQFGRFRIPPQAATPDGPIYVNAAAVYGCSWGALRLDRRVTT